MNKFLKIIILSISLFSGCSAKLDYKLIDIGECKIPISKSLQQSKGQQYSFSLPITPKNLNDDIKNISIYKNNYDSIEKFLKKLKQKSYPANFIKKYKEKNFTIIQYNFLGKNNHYNIYGDNFMIQLFYSSEEELSNIIETCVKTKK